VTFRCLRFSLRFHVSFRAETELLPLCCHPMHRTNSRRTYPVRCVSSPFRECLIGRDYSGLPETTWDFTGLLAVPLSLSDNTYHPNDSGRVAVSFFPRIQIGVWKQTSPEGWRLVRHSGRSATPQGDAVWPLRCAPLLEHTGKHPPRLRSGVLAAFSVPIRISTGRIRSVLPSLTAPFVWRLSTAFIRLTHPSQSWEGNPPSMKWEK
jgi:hypothetical protein